MKNKWKKVVALGVTSSVILGMTACGGSGEGSTGESGSKDSKDGITLTFWNAFTSTDGDVLKKIVEKYNKENDKGITIEMDVMPWDNLQEKLPVAIASGDAPDFVLMSSNYMPPYLESESFQDMSDFWDYEGVDKNNFEQNVVDMLQYDGKQLGIPMQVITHYLFWDKDLFEAAGIDPETPPTSLEQVAEYAEKLTDTSKNQYGFALGHNNTNTILETMMAFGGTIADESETTATLNSAENVQAFEWLDTVGKYSPSDVDDNTYISGQVAMYINGPWIIKGLRDNEINFGVTAIPPVTEGGDPAAQLVPVGFSIPKTTTEEHKQAVYDFVSYWNTTEICKKWTLECGTPPYLISAQEDPEIADDEITNILSEPLSYAEVIMKYKGTTQAGNDALNPAMEEIAGGADVQTTLDKYNDTVRSILN